MSFDDPPSTLIDADISRVPGAASRPSGYFWATTELATLRAVYPVGGVAAAMAALPHRKRSAIYGKARQLGVNAPRQLVGTAGKRFAKKYPTTDQIDQAIRDGYATATKRGDYTAIAVRCGRPAWWVQKRAAVLGVTRTNRTRLDAWKAAEIEILEEWAHCDAKVIRQKLARAEFDRTLTAICIQIKRRKLDRTDPDKWTAPDLAGLLGVNPATIADWINRRGLAATKRTHGPHGVWVLHRRDVRAWIRANPRFVDLRRVDQPWFMDLVFGSNST
jgi:ribosomal protein L37E